MASLHPSFILEYYDTDERPLLPTRIERVRPVLIRGPRPIPIRAPRPIPIRAPRPTLPPQSFHAIIYGDWGSTPTESNRTNTKVEGQNLLAAIRNPTWVDPRCVPKTEELHAPNTSSHSQSSDPETGRRSPVGRDWDPKRRERKVGSSGSSTSS
ncbi:hypothetical protein B0H21DRAFT_823360 [Amylocystis lapponica]|nr:hypothetical protein B0H21DRAFT_823360 [Amylocystis lapponica]